MNSKTKKIAFAGVMGALIFVVLTLETHVFVLLLNPTPAIFSIPIIFAVCFSDKWFNAFLAGALFGVCSFFVALTVGAAGEIFLNPLISIAPRIIVGIVSYLAYVGFSKLFKKAKGKVFREYLPASIGAFVGTITNTVLVLSMITLFSGGLLTAKTFQIILSVNFLFECLSGILITPILLYAIKKYNRTKMNVYVDELKNESETRCE